SEIEARAAEVEIDRPLGAVVGDPGLVEQVLVELIDNGLHFVPEGTVPRIRLWCEERKGLARLWIEDNGVGIAPEYQEKVFHIFERLDERRRGTGIGLAIVAKAVERMKGRAGVESEAGR